MAFEFDETRDPIIIVRAEHVHTDEEYRAYLDRCTEYTRRAEPYVLVFDLRKAGLPVPSHVPMQVAWMREHGGNQTGTTLGTAFVVSSAFIRFGLSAVFAAQPARVALHVDSELDSAIRWAEARVQSRANAVAS